jgi:hypothetical protein
MQKFDYDSQALTTQLLSTSRLPAANCRDKTVETDLPWKGKLHHREGYERKEKFAAVVTSTSVTFPYRGDQFLQKLGVSDN